MATVPPFVPHSGQTAAASGPRYKRTRRGDFAIWWREIDRVLLGLVLTLMAIGTLAVAAASPASARRLSTSAVRLEDLHFFYIHLRWQFLGLVALIGASMLPRDLARRLVGVVQARRAAA